jgi:hypothetical protein
MIILFRRKAGSLSNRGGHGPGDRARRGPDDKHAKNPAET